VLPEYNHLMRLLFVADGRSPIAQTWIRYFAQRGDEVYIASTFACTLDFPVKRLDIVPVAFSSIWRPRGRSAAPTQTLRFRSALRHWLGPLTIPSAAWRLRRLVRQINPDLIHALRIPYEGMLAASSAREAPLIVSVWGNDFTLHAPSTPLLKRYTRRTLEAADALHADCQRDVRLAEGLGFYPGQPTLVVPGNGGVRTDVFHRSRRPAKEPVVINPRGARAYVRNDVFFKAIPLVLERRPEARFVCASMAGDQQALRWIRSLGIHQAVDLLEPVPHDEMGDAFRRAQVLVSPSLHDGTPNSLLEGMACGCFPIAGDLESIREWITNGRNGLLVDATSPESIAEAVVVALDRKDLRAEAAGLNAKIIASRAEYALCMSRAEAFYRTVLESP